MRDGLKSLAFERGSDVIRRMPESWARGLFNAGADIAWRRQGHGIQVLESNLLRVWPDADGKELRNLSREAVRSYARYYCEAFRPQTYEKERVLAATHTEGPGEQTAFSHLRNGRGVIFALPHMGNFEQAGAWIIARGADGFTTVMERLKPESVYQKFLDFREQIGMEVLPLTGGPSPFGILAQRLRAGRLVCLVADRDLTESGVEVEFFGEKARMSAGSAVLAERTGAALMPVSCWFAGEDEWAAHIYDEIPVPAEGDRSEKARVMTQQLARVFEQAIREHPSDWHMMQRVFTADLDASRLPPA